MSTPTLAEKDAATILAEALAEYKTQTGVDLAAADPRRLHLQTILLWLVQQRALIDFAGKQSLLRYVSDDWIEELGQLWGSDGDRIPAVASTVTLRFTAAVPGVLTIPIGTRATDGTYTWAVIATTVSGAGASYVDAVARCTVTGEASNDVAIGLINTLVDLIPNIASVANTTISALGADQETLAAYRERLRTLPLSTAVAGPYGAYEALARAASTDVDEAIVLGPEDAAYIAGTPPGPGDVHVHITEVGETSPSAALLATVEAALSAETVRPLTDHVRVLPPTPHAYEIDVTYYIATSRSASASEIQEAVEAAFEAYKTWQSGRVGRDINPSELISRLMVAGAKRVVVADPAYDELLRDEIALLTYDTLTFGGIEDD